MDKQLNRESCNKCKELKTRDSFFRDNNRSNGLRAWCKECCKASNKVSYERRMSDPDYRAFHVDRTLAWNAKNPEISERTKRRSHLKRAYGVTLEWYEALHEEQGGLCAICGNPEARGRWLSVDHNHDTGQIRSLLCSLCNTAIGMTREDLEWFAKAKAYLERWS